MVDQWTETEEDFTTGTYRCRDDISNLRIHVKIRKVTSISSHLANTNLSLSDSLESIRSTGPGAIGSSSSASDHPDKEKDRPDDDFEFLSFSWQEKHFSPSEIKFYTASKQEDFTEDILKLKFFRDVQALMKQKKGATNYKQCQLFTCIDKELYNSEEEHLISRDYLTTNPNEEPNFLSLLMADGLRKRRSTSTHLTPGQASHRTSIPTQNIIDYAPTKETQIKLHSLTDVCQTMIIRMAIPGETEADKADHVDLCVIKYWPKTGLLEVSPDFTFHRKPYRIEMETQGKEKYDYWIEHISQDMDYDDQIRESVMLGEVLQRHSQLRRAEVGNDFESPIGRSFRFVVFGEIVTAHDFDSYGSKVFVHYFVNLPVGWSVSEQTTNADLSGMTQLSAITAIGGQDVAHFSHPFTLDLQFDINRLDQQGKETKSSLPKWPQIFVEVISLDSWMRCRTEGYGFSPLPLNPGTYDKVKISTWRPILKGPTTEMRRYFIGGTPELEDLSYCGTPALLSDQDRVFSRYGFRTMSSGTVRLRMNVVHQAKAFVSSTSFKNERLKKRSHLIDRLASATLFNSVSSVMEAFKKARERMMKATEHFQQV